jgi:membrane protease YdiL (CAAX protease family)
MGDEPDKASGGPGGTPTGPVWPPPSQPSPYGHTAPPPYPSGYAAPPPYPSGYAAPPPYPSGHGGRAPMPPQARAFPHAEPEPYHHMLRTWTYAPWRPVVGIVIALAGMLVIAPLALLPVLAAAVAVEGGPFLRTFERAATLKSVDPAALLYLNLVLASMVLVTWFVIRVVHRMRPRWLSSVVPRMRWSFFLVCLGLAVVALVAQVLVGFLLPGSDGQGGSGTLNHFTTGTAVSALVILLTTPFQAAGEEFLFRGYLLMAVGSLIPQRTVGRWVAIVSTALLFALFHGAQNFPLFFDRFAFGLIAGWLVTRTGGLEAGIALHILNNFLAFGIALAYGDLTSTLNVSQVSWWNIVLTVTQSGVYTVLVVLVARRRGLQTHTRPPGRLPWTVPGSAAATA